MPHLLALLLLECFLHSFLLPASPLGVQGPSAKVLEWYSAGKVWAHWCIAGWCWFFWAVGLKLHLLLFGPYMTDSSSGRRCCYSLFLFLSFFASGFALQPSIFSGNVFQVWFICNNREAQMISLTLWPVLSMFSWSQDHGTPECLLYSSFLAVSLQTCRDLTFRSSGCPCSY